MLLVTLSVLQNFAKQYWVILQNEIYSASIENECT